MDRKSQVRTLLLDEMNPMWTRAHLALYLIDAMDRKDDTWTVLFNRANIAIMNRDFDLFDIVMDIMKREVGWTKEDQQKVSEGRL